MKQKLSVGRLYRYPDVMDAAADSLSILVIDENPDVLTFFARLLEANNIRALLARGADEAVSIAEREYIPIDLVLVNVLHQHDSRGSGNGNGGGTDVLDHLRHLRGHLRVLYMSAWVDSDVIRVELLERGLSYMTRKSGDESLVNAIRNAAVRPRARTAG